VRWTFRPAAKTDTPAKSLLIQAPNAALERLVAELKFNPTDSSSWLHALHSRCVA
jgi:hypothetical protein